MSAEHATPEADSRTELNALYPGQWALLLVRLCHPTPHEHNRRHQRVDGAVEWISEPCAHPGKAPLGRGWNDEALARLERFGHLADDGARAARDAHLREIARHFDEGRGNVGLVVPDGVLILDTDSQEHTAALAARLPDDGPMQATHRGGHFVVGLELPEGLVVAKGTKVNLGGGLEADVMVPRKQIVVEPSIHPSGTSYTWKRALPAQLTDVPKAPPWLLPALVAAVKKRPRGAATLVEGERNERLFKIGSAIRGRGGNQDEILGELRRVNGDRELCPQPLDDTEVQKIAASAASYPAASVAGLVPDAAGADEFFTSKGTLIAPRLAAAIRELGHLKLAHDGRLARYDNGVYRLDGDDFARVKVREMLGLRCKRAHFEEVLAWLRADFRVVGATPPGRWINTPSGLLDWRTGQLEAHSPDVLTLTQIPVAWNPAARCPGIDCFLNEVLPEETVALVHETIGYALYPGNPMRKAVLLLGPGRNGKSVLLSIIKALLGPANVSAVTLQAFGENRFAGAELFGRLANIAGDLDARAIRNTDLFKMITGGTDAIQAERKFRDSFNFVPFALPIFSANEAPQSADQSDAWFDRWLIVPMERRIADEVADPHLGERLTTEPELRGLLVHAVAGLRRLMARGRFELSEAVQRAQVSYRERLDTIESFLTDATVRVASAWTPRPQLYRGYRAWCEAEGRIAVSPGMLCEQLRRRGVRESKRRGVWGWDGLGLAA